MILIAAIQADDRQGLRQALEDIDQMLKIQFFFGVTTWSTDCMVVTDVQIASNIGLADSILEFLKEENIVVKKEKSNV